MCYATILLLLLAATVAPPQYYYYVSATDFDVGITTLTDVTSISQIAYDVRDMVDAIENNDYVTARRIYESGKNAVQYDEYGQEMDDFLSLRSMARAGRSIYVEDPTYAFHMLGLANNAAEDVEQTLGLRGAYADEYIMTMLLDEDDGGTLGAQATTILVVSQYSSHMLWKGIMDCLAVKDGYKPDFHLDPRHSFDDYIALYVGAGQTLAPEWDGDMLYELAQAGGERFGTVDELEGEAYVNADIKLLYQNIQRLLAGEDYCTRDDQIESLWRYVNQILAKMYIPLVQMLIHSMKEEDQANKVRMYALAFIPQLSQCRSSVHLKLKEYLLDREYDRDDFPRILDLLQQSYDCLGIKCTDVGAYIDKDTDEIAIAECTDIDTNHPLASFIPKEDVRTLSKVDLDIHAINQLLQFPTTTNHRMAQLYYQYGRASALDDNEDRGRMSSIYAMIISTDIRRWSPYYDDYIHYFQGMTIGADPVSTSEMMVYEGGVVNNATIRAHDVIMAAFDGTGIFTSGMTNEQRNAYIVSVIRHNVLPEYMMGLLGLANQVCRDTVEENDVPPTLHWDAFAALYIGSMEGISRDDVTDDGYMMWSLAANRARNFNTQTDQFTAIINEEMMDLLFAGQAELERNDCDSFDKSFSRVLHLLLLPLIQSTIWYAIRNEDAATDDTDVAIGQVMALSVLPIVQKFEPNAASAIERNMLMVDGEFQSPVFEGAQTVANAFGPIFDNLGWDCEYVGQADGVEACQEATYSNSISGIPTYVALMVMVVFGVIIGLVLFLKFVQIVRRKSMKKEVERGRASFAASIASSNSETGNIVLVDELPSPRMTSNGHNKILSSANDLEHEVI